MLNERKYRFRVDEKGVPRPVDSGREAQATRHVKLYNSSINIAGKVRYKSEGDTVLVTTADGKKIEAKQWLEYAAVSLPVSQLLTEETRKPKRTPTDLNSDQLDFEKLFKLAAAKKFNLKEGYLRMERKPKESKLGEYMELDIRKPGSLEKNWRYIVDQWNARAKDELNLTFDLFYTLRDYSKDADIPPTEWGKGKDDKKKLEDAKAKT